MLPNFEGQDQSASTFNTYPPNFSTEVPGTMVMAGVVRRFIWNELLAGERTIRQKYQQINEQMGIALGYSECP